MKEWWILGKLRILIVDTPTSYAAALSERDYENGLCGRGTTRGEAVASLFVLAGVKDNQI